MKSISFNQFVIQAGNDFFGLATEMLTVSSTLKLIYQNRGTFFGVHVTSTPTDLSYSQLPLATGTIKKFYQSRKTENSECDMAWESYPLYGGGADLSNKEGVLNAPLPLTLKFVVRSRAFVLGKLVKPKFYKRIQCSVVLDPKKMNLAISLKKSCTYQ